MNGHYPDSCQYMEKKDYFSNQSKVYAAFRPAYPPALYQFIFKHVKNRSVAWDCGTGNGQVAQYLANYFDTVYATDISEKQIDHSFPAKNILYLVGAAEHTNFRENQFDLITVAQALHWFNMDAFYKEVRRTAKPNGLLAVWGYALLGIEPVIDEMFMDFYKNTTGPYWHTSRKLIENEYRNIPFPFEQIACPEFTIKVKWTLDQFAGYLNSWSATQKYIQVRGINPVDKFVNTLKSFWKEGDLKVVTFPVFMKLGRVHP
jgi:ubiquinone/menaquinone biosynthesis C-methylase UbiE